VTTKLSDWDVSADQLKRTNMMAGQGSAVKNTHSFQLLQRLDLLLNEVILDIIGM
jgi:hypothetical protein